MQMLLYSHCKELPLMWASSQRRQPFLGPGLHQAFLSSPRVGCAACWERQMTEAIKHSPVVRVPSGNIVMAITLHTVVSNRLEAGWQAQETLGGESETMAYIALPFSHPIPL